MDCAFDEIAFNAVAFDVCVTPPPIPPAQMAGNVRHLRYIEPLFNLSADDLKRKRRKREEEEIIIL